MLGKWVTGQWEELNTQGDCVVLTLLCECVCVVVDMLLDLKRRKEWDSVFIQIDILEETDDYKVVYW